MKPIEAGCKAIVISSLGHVSNIGKVVKVVMLVTAGFKFKVDAVCGRGYHLTADGASNPTERVWLVEGDITFGYMCGDGETYPLKGTFTAGDIVGNGILNERSLMRIDGFEEDLKVKEKDLLLTE